MSFASGKFPQDLPDTRRCKGSGKEVDVLRVGLILPADFHVMSYATLATFETANFIAGDQFYDVSILSEHGGPVPNSFGMATETEPLDVKPFDTLLVGAACAPTPPTPKLLTFLREAVTDVRRVASICIGAFILAEAGFSTGGAPVALPDPSWATTCPRASRRLADQWFHGSRGAKLRTNRATTTLEAPDLLHSVRGTSDGGLMTRTSRRRLGGMTAQIGYDGLDLRGDPRPELLIEVARVQPEPGCDWVRSRPAGLSLDSAVVDRRLSPAAWRWRRGRLS